MAQFLKILDFEPDNSGALNNLNYLPKNVEFEKAEEFYFTTGNYSEILNLILIWVMFIISKNIKSIEYFLKLFN